MKPYYTKQEKNIANQVPMKALLEQLQEPIKKRGKEYRWQKHNSFTMKNNVWYQHSMQRGGLPIDFLMTFYDYTFPQAVDYLLTNFNTDNYPINFSYQPRNELDIPKRSMTNHNVMTYLCSYRFIAKTVVEYLIENDFLYEDQKYHNCVFVGKDEDGNIRHVHKRSSFDSMHTYKGNSDRSLAEYSFHILGNSSELFAFEAPIDLCSYISLHLDNWLDHSYVALCGLSSQAIEWIIKNKEITKIHLCLDNDFAGQEANFRIKMELLEKYDIEVDEIVPRFKDFNEDLRFKYNQPVRSGITDPFYELVNELYKRIISETAKMKDQRYKDLMDTMSIFFYGKLSDNPKQKLKGYDALIDSAKISLLLARQQYRHLERQCTIQELIQEFNQDETFTQYCDKDEKCSGILKELTIIKNYFTTLEFDLKEDKLEVIEACKNLAKRCIYTYVYLTLKERKKQK